MAIDFPSSPSVNDTFASAGVTYTWDGTVWAAGGAYDANVAKTNQAQTFTAEQTFGELKEGVFALNNSGTIALDPANGSVQTAVLTGAPTFTDSFESGQSIVLQLEGGDTNTVTWPTMTWSTSGGNVAPTLTAKDTLAIWKVGAVLYGAYVGSYV